MGRAPGPDQRIAAVLSRLEESAFRGEVWKHTMPGQPPEAANVRGARWNPRDVNTLYLSLSRHVALAEGNHLARSQPLPLKPGRRIYHGELELTRVLDLTDRTLLASLGVTAEELSSSDQGACRSVGETAAWLGFEAMVVPSARSDGFNLVIFEQNLPTDFEVTFESFEAADSQDTAVEPDGVA